MNLRAILLASAVLLAGCGGKLCEHDCPDISGAYAVRSMSINGECEFQPLTVEPTFVIEQSEDFRRVFASFVDPVNELPYIISADVSRLDEGEGASFSGFAKIARQSSRYSNDLVPFMLTLTGTVHVSEGRRWLTAFLSMRPLYEPCSVALTFTGAGPFVLMEEQEDGCWWAPPGLIHVDD